jgi:hypothetical protein
MISLERYGRLIDIHIFPKVDRLACLQARIEGFHLPIPPESGHGIPRGKTQIVKTKRVASQDFRQLCRRRIAAGPAGAAKFVSYQVGNSLSGLVSRRPRKLSFLSFTEFLAMRIGSEDSVNWVWRHAHWTLVFYQGETFGQALTRIRQTALPMGVPSDTSRPFDEPINLSRQFRQSGNNSLLAPVRFGFRHLVIPYLAANLYINRRIQPNLYSTSILNPCRK